jgi:CheY-like chemotaxis protein
MACRLLDVDSVPFPMDPSWTACEPVLTLHPASGVAPSGNWNVVSSEKIGRSLRVLVVDDEPLIAMGVCDMLEDLGHQAESAYSGGEALALLGGGQAFDLIITDQTMPDMAGTDLARAALRRDEKVRVFLSTGHSEIEGAAGLDLPRLNKPYALPDLAALIVAQFGGS